MNYPLIAPKSFANFTPDEYHEYVKGFYELRARSKSKAKPSAVEGLSITRLKTGKLSVRSKRPFEWVLHGEIEALATEKGYAVTEVRDAFEARKFIIVDTRIEAERINSGVSEVS